MWMIQSRKTTAKVLAAATAGCRLKVDMNKPTAVMAHINRNNPSRPQASCPGSMLVPK